MTTMLMKLPALAMTAVCGGGCLEVHDCVGCVALGDASSQPCTAAR
jgi:hypothetical protein